MIEGLKARAVTDSSKLYLITTIPMIMRVPSSVTKPIRSMALIMKVREASMSRRLKILTTIMERGEKRKWMRIVMQTGRRVISR